MNTDEQDKMKPDPAKEPTPPPGTHKVTDMDTGEVTFEPDQAPAAGAEEDIMDFADGSDGGAATDGEGA